MTALTRGGKQNTVLTILIYIRLFIILLTKYVFKNATMQSSAESDKGSNVNAMLAQAKTYYAKAAAERQEALAA